MNSRHQTSSNPLSAALTKTFINASFRIKYQGNKTMRVARKEAKAKVLHKEIIKANEDQKFRKSLKEFIDYHEGRL
jgi:hypothetical protein